ncbi:MAG: FtsX-like permease family protein, partial [Bryobacteraceae bacterium]|nr:FtsX-like permease family protein [Bryobacteraceae bacterium]
RNVGHALVREFPLEYRGRAGGPSRFTFKTIPLREAIVGTQRPLLWLLVGGAAILLMIACANTAQLLLARSLRRGREVAIRTALGASRFCLIRQFLLEGLVLAAVGGAAGLLLSAWIISLLKSVLPVRSPLLESAHLDLTVVVFTLAISLISTLAFASLPAVKGSKWTPGPSLSARPATGEGNRWRYAMIALQAALSVFLLCSAGLVCQNFLALISAPLGFDPTHLLTMQLKLPSGAQNAVDQKAGLAFQQYVDKITAIPGVDSAATVTGPPLRPSRGGPVELAGQTDSTGDLRSVVAMTHQVSPDYFRTLRIPLLAGRNFNRGDAGTQVTVAIVNEEFARRFGLGSSVVGKQMFEPGQPITIVGMVGNVRTHGIEPAPFPEVYLSSLQMSWVNVYLIVRSAIPPAELAKLVTQAIQSSNSGQAIYGVLTMHDLIADSVTQPKFHVILIGAFALLAVAMSAAGLYSVISCLVAQRTSEIAIRIALGATHSDVFKTVLGSSAIWVTAGLVSGLALGLATASTVRALSGTVVEPSPWMYFSVVLFFLSIALIAAASPMQRAARLDPGTALRWE